MKNVVQDLTSGGVDWQREKWQSGFGSKFIRQGEKNAVKYADEIGGDMAEVWYTHCLKEYLFPEFQGEKFLGEDIVWVRMSEKYKMRFFNRVIYVSDYLEDGLTNNRRKHNIKSPNGCVARAEAFLDSDSNIKAKIKAALQYQIYGKFAGVGEIDLFRKSKNKMMFIVFAVPARLLYWKWNFADQG